MERFDDPRATGAGRDRGRRVLEVAGSLLAEQSRLRIGLSAAGGAFWLAIALLPMLAAVVSVYGLVRSPAKVAGDLSSLLHNAPGSLAALVGRQLSNVARTGHETLSVELVVSIVLALWAASASIYNMDRAIGAAYRLPVVSYLRARARALVGALATVLVIGVIAGLSSLIGALFHHHHALEVVAGVPAFVVVLSVLLDLLFRFALGRERSGRRFAPGAVGAAVAVTVLVAGFDVYVRLAGYHTALYGALAGLVLSMLFAYAATYAVLLGAVLNATLDRRRSWSGGAPAS